MRAVRRTRSHESLRTTVAILRAQQEATIDGILVVDTDGRVLSYNRRFVEIFNIPPIALATGQDQALLEAARALITDPDGFLADVQHLYAHPREIRTSDVIQLADGRTLTRSSVPVESHGKITGRAWYFRDITAERRADQVQSALFRIARLSSEAHELGELYPALHGIVGELMDATNFYVAEYDPERKFVNYPYYVDQQDPAPSGPEPVGRGVTAYVMRTGQPLRTTPELFQHLIDTGEVDLIGSPSVDWIGVPLKTGGVTWGMMGVQSYDEKVRYTERDKEILAVIAQQVASAIEQTRREEALRMSEVRYRQMFENNRAVQIVLDPANGRIVDANLAACDFYGYTRDELRAMFIWNINVLSQEQIREEMERAARQQRSYFVFRHMLSTGLIRDVEVHSGPIEVGGRKLLYSIIHDVTERKRAEEARQQSEERYRNIFDYASVGIYQSTVDGKIITANPTLARILGYDSVDELLAKNLTNDIYLEPHRRDEIVREHMQTRRPGNYEVCWRRKDGAPVWVQLNAHAIADEQHGVYFEGFVYDITERRQAEESLAAADSQRKAVLDAATGVSIVATDADGVITVFNSGAERLLGYNADDVIGKMRLADFHESDELEARRRDLSNAYRREVKDFDALALEASLYDVEEREWTYVVRDGTTRTVTVSVTALRGTDTAITGFLFVATDITERKHAEEMLRKQSAAMTASMDGIAILNDRLEFTYVNDALAKLFGYGKPQLLSGQSLVQLYDPEEGERLLNQIVPHVRDRGRWRGEAKGRRRDGITFPQEVSLTTIDGGGMVCVVRDITERTYAEEQIKHLAYHDALTGLPNRLLFKDRLTVALSHAQRDRARLAVLFLDLDRFKVINDSLGHNIGDQLLQAVAARVQSCVRESDTVARLGGDEFTLLLPLNRSDDAAPVAQKILEAIRYPFHIEGREFFITTSLGISLYPEDGTDAETLIKNADTAMYQAKELGRDNYQLFNAFVNAKALQRIALEHGLRRALANDEMAVHYQPIVDFRDSRITGMEALLRWTHPQMGRVPPGVFIPVAEATGVMVPIGTWAMRAACAQAKEWHDAGYGHLSLAVNLSVHQLQSPDLLDRVKEILDETGFPARLLDLEITESGAMQAPEISIRALYELKKLGIRISLDDFGTGHSSLSYLKRFPIDTLKIDQSFVRDINSDPDTAAIVTAIIAMAHSLRLDVVAEGVEFADQAKFLRRYGCDHMQGYLVKPPVPADEFIDLLKLPVNI
jgi:diguanylate cyclase (GGDEF)-like protein/PAS domain S-box-containing protein